MNKDSISDEEEEEEGESGNPVLRRLGEVAAVFLLLTGVEQGSPSRHVIINISPCTPYQKMINETISFLTRREKQREREGERERERVLPVCVNVMQSSSWKNCPKTFFLGPGWPPRP